MERFIKYIVAWIEKEPEQFYGELRVETFESSELEYAKDLYKHVLENKCHKVNPEAMFLNRETGKMVGTELPYWQLEHVYNRN